MALLGGAVISLVLLTSWGGTTYPWRSPRDHRPRRGDAGAGRGLAGLGPARGGPGYPAAAVPWPRFSIACAISLILGIAMFGAITYLPTYLQIVTGVSATDSGLLLLPLIIGLLVTSITSGRLIAGPATIRSTRSPARRWRLSGCTCCPA